MTFQELFKNTKPVIACIHLQALPGAPLYSGKFDDILEKALSEVELYKSNGISALIVENFRDNPFYPGKLPAETIAAMAVLTNEIKKVFGGPVGVNALRNDAHAALGIAVASKADFIRVNIHTGAALTDQGIIEGKAHETLRLKKSLGSTLLIFADVAVKHASPLGNRSIELEANDATNRGLADAVIVSGSATGEEANQTDVIRVKQSVNKPVIIGSGTTPDNLAMLYSLADGFIVGSYFKFDGKALNDVDPDRVKTFMVKYNNLR